VPRAFSRWASLLLVLSLGLGVSAARAANAPVPVYVVLWFDTEDYILPASDDAALHLADFLSREGVRATFKIVGEKARTLQQRRRRDVIAALQKHEIGYHTNFHSTQPTPAQYLYNLGWDEGVAEFDRREHSGFEEVQRIFSTAPTCYGQPGSSWGPQVFGALRRWGVPVYLDAGSHVGLENRPCYYGGLLNLFQLAHTLRADLNRPAHLPAAQERFLSARARLQKEGGGIVSIYYHPCEFVHKQFWDGVNFHRGANPPRERWELPPAQSPQESQACYDVFEKYIRFIKSQDGVRFVTAGETARLYRDRARGRIFSPAVLRTVARGVTDKVTFQKHGDFSLSASEVLALLSEYVCRKTAGTEAGNTELKDTPYGPTGTVVSLSGPVTTDDSQFLRTTADVVDFLHRQGRVPSAVWLGSVPVPPESYLPALAEVAQALLSGQPMPKTIEVRPAQLAVAANVAEDGPHLWGWVIFPKGFRAPEMMQLAKSRPGL
jgi:hypothetical protein